MFELDIFISIFKYVRIFKQARSKGLAGVAVVDGDNIIKQKQAFARGCESSFPHSSGGAVGFNASQGRCFGH
jgi:hypothetical protein